METVKSFCGDHVRTIFKPIAMISFVCLSESKMFAYFVHRR